MSGASPGDARRSTRQAAAITAALRRAGGFRSAQDIHALLRDTPDSVGLATVYRRLQALAAEGLVDSLQTAEGQALYRLCGGQHHHHLVCRRCGRAAEIEGSAVEEWAAAVARECGFTDVSHTVELFGLCNTCRDA